MDNLAPPFSRSTEPASVRPEVHLGFGGYVSPEGSLTGVGFGRRLCAYLIDLVLHYIVATCAGFFLGLVLGLMSVATHQPAAVLISRFTNGPAWPAFLTAIVGALAYHCITEGLHGSTLGKQVLGMVVVQEDGTPCRIGSALVRGLAFYIDSLFFGLVGYMHMQKSNMQQRYGDDWAHTVVCRKSEIKPENLRGTGAFVGALALGIVADGMLMLVGYTLRML